MVSLRSSDRKVDNWLMECLAPWFRAAEPQPGSWKVTITACQKEYAGLLEARPADAARRTCFTFDQFVFSLPAWRDGDRIVLADDARSCCLVMAPSEARLVADPGARRWRMMALWLLLEIATTASRGSHIDLHAACVEASGRALLIAGPKKAGKTTLMLHLLRSGLCGWITNDRALAGAEPREVTGIPAAVRIRASTMDRFPELFHGMPDAARPYLYTLDELAGGNFNDGDEETDMVALSPAQFCRQMNVQPVGTAPAGAVVFPRLAAGMDGWFIERLEAPAVRTALRSNIYGRTLERRGPTVLEELTGIAAAPSAETLDSLAENVPGYRLVLGPDACDEPDFAARLFESLQLP